jgi:molybdopterin synthase sulfur carrier subunit
MTDRNGNEVTLRIPTPLRGYAGQQSSIVLRGATVGEAIGGLVEQYPALRKHLLDDDGRLRSFVNLYLNGEEIGELGGVEAPLAAGDKLALIPAIAGGASR